MLTLFTNEETESQRSEVTATRSHRNARGRTQRRHRTQNPVLFPLEGRLIFRGITLHARVLDGKRAQSPWPSMFVLICGAWPVPINGAQRAPKEQSDIILPFPFWFALFKLPRSCHSLGLSPSELSMAPPAELLGNCIWSEPGPSVTGPPMPTPIVWKLCVGVCMFLSVAGVGHEQSNHNFSLLFFISNIFVLKVI